MLTKIRNATPDWAWAGLVTFAVTFASLFGASATGWWEGFVAWFTTEGVEFPSLSVLVSAAMSAAGAAFPAAINAAYRYFQAQGVLRGSGPEYPVE